MRHFNQRLQLKQLTNDPRYRMVWFLFIQSVLHHGIADTTMPRSAVRAAFSLRQHRDMGETVDDAASKKMSKISMAERQALFVGVT
mmetsp:Transcript_38912/g.57859  ORF Transcript_38912/g.57859 Transcript_38912/m.57859 type:complete len:86 (-) Transcript_38912:1087-1344(-)